MIKVEEIKKLRKETGAGIADIKAAIEEAGGNMEKAKEVLKKKGLNIATKKESREVRNGLVEVYSHNGKVGVIVEVLCETDFVAKTEEFKTLAHELALQIASMNPSSNEELLKQEYIRDGAITIGDLIKSVIGKLGENIKIGKFSRIELGS